VSRRIRSIKPDVWDDEALGECSTSARLLFVGLITQADDDGRLPGNPRWIASKVYPYDDDITSADIKGWLAELDRVDVVHLYESSGKTYIALPAWDSHQTIDKRYYKPSRLPAPPPERPSSARGGLDGDPRDAGTGADERSTPDRIGEDRRGEDGIGEESEARAPDAPPPTSLSASERESAPEIVAVCETLADLIESNGSKRPTDAQVNGWRKDVRLMVEQDGRTLEQIEAAAKWAQSHGFWRANVMSMGKLRERFDQLRLQAQRDRGGSTASEHPADRRMRELREERERLDAEGAVA
jgi:hypothetical protein